MLLIENHSKPLQGTVRCKSYVNRSTSQKNCMQLNKLKIKMINIWNNKLYVISQKMVTNLAQNNLCVKRIEIWSVKRYAISNWK